MIGTLGSDVSEGMLHAETGELTPVDPVPLAVVMLVTLIRCIPSDTFTRLAAKINVVSTPPDHGGWSASTAVTFLHCTLLVSTCGTSPVAVVELIWTVLAI